MLNYDIFAGLMLGIIGTSTFFLSIKLLYWGWLRLRGAFKSPILTGLGIGLILVLFFFWGGRTP